MIPGVVIATFGDEAWAQRGADLAQLVFFEQGVPVAYLHLGGGGEPIQGPEQAGVMLAMARNEGAARLFGRSPEVDWLCFLDADDVLALGYFDAMRAASGSECELLVPAVEYRLEDGTIHEPARVLNDGRPLLDVNRAVVGTLVSRCLFEHVGGWHALPIYEDWELWLRCEREGATLVDVPDAVYVAGVRLDSRNRADRHLAEHWYWKIRRDEERARGIR